MTEYCRTTKKHKKSQVILSRVADFGVWYWLGCAYGTGSYPALKDFRDFR